MKNKKKYYYGEWEDYMDDFSPTPSSTYKSKWGDWGTKWGKSTYNFDSIEEKMNRKKDIENELGKFIIDNGIIAKTYINSDTSIARKSGLYTISINNTPNWREELRFLRTGFGTWKKLPSSEKVKDNTALLSTLIDNYSKGTLDKLFRNTKLYHDGNTAEIKRLMSLIQTTLSKPFINDADVDTLIGSIPEGVKKDLKSAQGHGGISTLVDQYTNIKKKKGKLKITPPTDRYVKYPHLSKGKRINKGFIQQTDYRALRVKEKVKVNKKKLLILIDGSGSMRGEPYNLGVNFIADLINLNVFDIDVYHTTDTRVTNVNNSIESWINGTSKGKFIQTDGSEGFPYLTSRMGGVSRNEDYVLIITDMRVPDDAEENLKAFIGSKKHLILSFAEKGKFGCNVRIVQKYDDMKNVVTTLLSN